MDVSHHPEPFANAMRFFLACERLEGWTACESLVADGALFNGRCASQAPVRTIKEYVDWWTGCGSGPLQGCRHSLNASAWDESSRTALFFATLHARHSGPGGPVPPTGRYTLADYVYALRVDGNGLIKHMTKIWNSDLSMRELGWA